METTKVIINNCRLFLYLPLTLMVFGLSSCKKDFLDKKPSKGLLVPTTLTDFDALLDNTQVFNIGGELNEIASDDLYITTEGWSSFSTPQEQNAYIFADDVYKGQTFISEWDTPYQQVFYSNVVLDGLARLNSKVNSSDYNRIKGAALFHRAFAFFNVAQLFAKPYNPQTSGSDLGIPLRLTADVNQKSVRSNLEDTYQRIITDLKAAVDLLPITPKFKTRPGGTAALAMLARVYLTMGDYVNAGRNADSCLTGYNKLYDYNTLDSSSYSPFPQVLPDNGDEIIFYTRLTGYSYEYNSLCFITRDLYGSYGVNDLRRGLFFVSNGSGDHNYKGTYEGNYYFFGGIATDEVYLIRAECYARNGKTTLAMSDLNALLFTRAKSGSYTPLTATGSDDALKIILKERRKELVARGLRWIDLRRLNADPRFQVVVKHDINGHAYQLEPNGKHYVFPIPDYEIKTSDIQQN
jgi:hypothetical protein